jgi:hypothetical protein
VAYYDLLAFCCVFLKMMVVEEDNLVDIKIDFVLLVVYELDIS